LGRFVMERDLPRNMIRFADRFKHICDIASILSKLLGCLLKVYFVYMCIETKQVQIMLSNVKFEASYSNYNIYRLETILYIQVFTKA
jgi:hypothetical protein